MASDVLFSSKASDWKTPPELFAAASKRWGPFTLDAATSRDNPLGTPWYFTDQCDTLAAHAWSKCCGNAFESDWFGRVWLNPPYGREIGKWIERAYQQVENGHAERVVCLVPARTDTRWWQRYVLCADDIIYLAGRVRFSGAKAGAPFPSAIVVFEREFDYDRR